MSGFMQGRRVLIKRWVGITSGISVQRQHCSLIFDKATQVCLSLIVEQAVLHHDLFLPGARMPTTEARGSPPVHVDVTLFQVLLHV